MGWLPLPDDDPYFFGFDGPDAIKAARTMNAAIRRAVEETRTLASEIRLRIADAALNGGLFGGYFAVRAAVADGVARMKAKARETWMKLAGLLWKFSSSDFKPGESRAACSEPFRILYLQLAQKMDKRAAPLRSLYLQLSDKVDTYFTTLPQA